jgi:hypothetical protein
LVLRTTTSLCPPEQPGHDGAEELPRRAPAVVEARGHRGYSPILDAATTQTALGLAQEPGALDPGRVGDKPSRARVRREERGKVKRKP